MRKRLFYEAAFILIVSIAAFFGFPLLFGDAPYFDIWSGLYFLAVIVILVLYVFHKMGIDINVTSSEFDKKIKYRLLEHNDKYEKAYTVLSRVVWFITIFVFGGIILYGNFR